VVDIDQGALAIRTHAAAELTGKAPGSIRGPRRAATSRQPYLSAALALACSAGSVAPPVARAGAQARVAVPPVTIGLMFEP
jgi:hypothetical protein